MASSVSTLLVLLLGTATWIAEAQRGSGKFNIMDFGAKANGKTDDAKALSNAWTQACAWNGQSTLVIPRGKYLVSRVEIKGPCKGPTVIHLDGSVNSPPSHEENSWITFSYIDRFTIKGKGKFDGQGALAWSKNECHKGGHCKQAVSLRFNFITNGLIRGISSVNAKYFHVNVLGCKNVRFDQFTISAPHESLNTDGIHMGKSSGIEIINSVIGTGDDCISIGDGTKNLTIINVTCGPGHGISIGSLGKYDNEEPVTGVTVRNCTFIGTDNGVRIKTWSAMKGGEVSNIRFEDIVMKNVYNPIVIDQEYCPHNKCDKSKPSLVKISNVIIKNIRGTSTSEESIRILCSSGFPCKGFELSNINLKYVGKFKPVPSTCKNVKAVVSGKVFPPTCV